MRRLLELFYLFVDFINYRTKVLFIPYLKVFFCFETDFPYYWFLFTFSKISLELMGVRTSGSSQSSDKEPGGFHIKSLLEGLFYLFKDKFPMPDTTKVPISDPEGHTYYPY